MYKDCLIATVVPAHNEASHISQVIKTMPDFVDHIIVVDDHSRDNTLEVAVACSDPRVIALKTPHNMGVGGATMFGYKKAVELGSQILVKMDGDGQMAPEYLELLLDALIEQGYDYAKGNRFLAGESLAFMPRHRLYGNIALTFMTKLASGYWNIFDPQNGYTAIKQEALTGLDLNAIHPRFFFENDMLVQLNFFSRRVKDVPIPARYGDEVSDLNPVKIGVTFPLLLLRRFFHRIYQKYVLRDFSPIALFLFLGLLLFGWGFIFGIYLWIEAMLTSQLTPTGTIMLSLLPLILGFQLILQAIVLDIQETPK
ncbi:MAG TPA: glycosyltransferase family 2 protein [Blastocatellia bacterium]|nr:glycosyltransferase family 2 protein [Blastocatellia bacterium]